MGKTHIEWATDVWNPIRGCSIVSEGCANCYAMREAWRHAGPGGAYEGLVRMTSKGARWTGEVRFVEHVLDQPLRWKRPRRIFVNSMSDLFHESLTDEQIARIWSVMYRAPQHIFQVLTKRPERMRDWLAKITHDGTEPAKVYYDGTSEGADIIVGDMDNWPLPNVWVGTSAENQETLNERILPLIETPAAVRWLSLEPLLGPMNIELAQCSCPWPADAMRTRHLLDCPSDVRRPDDQRRWRLDWVVVGGESGKYARPMHPEWARQIRDDCLTAGVPFFFKQWGEWAHVELVGGRMKIHGAGPFPLITNKNTCWLDDETPSVRLGKKAAGRELDGRTWNEYPVIRVAAGVDPSRDAGMVSGTEKRGQIHTRF